MCSNRGKPVQVRALPGHIKKGTPTECLGASPNQTSLLGGPCNEDCSVGGLYRSTPPPFWKLPCLGNPGVLVQRARQGDKQMWGLGFRVSGLEVCRKWKNYLKGHAVPTQL